MDIEIVERKENKLLNREEVYAIVKHPNSATPSRAEIRSKISAILGKDEKLVVIKKILSSYGKQISRVWVNIYNDEDSLRKLEPKYILKRNQLIQ